MSLGVDGGVTGQEDLLLALRETLGKSAGSYLIETLQHSRRNDVLIVIIMMSYNSFDDDLNFYQVLTMALFLIFYLRPTIAKPTI